MTTPPLTAALAGFALTPGASVPADAVLQASRAFLNFTGCALGAAGEPVVLKALAVARELGGSSSATAIGSPAGLDPLQAALINCLASSIHTFDDTHLATVIHPTGPVAAAALALLELRPQLAPDGTEFLTALALGIEVSCRVARVLTQPPARTNLGIFTTGVVGAIGAAVACARLAGLDQQRMVWAIGLAATQASGFRATHATMAGGMVPACAARDGLSAALWAGQGIDCNPQALEGPNGFLQMFAEGGDPGLALQGLGERYELRDLSYKAYPCGVVIHPIIDGCLDLRGEIAGAGITQVRLRVPPLSLQLTGLRQPQNAFDTKVSLFHWAAAALLRGHAGLQEATDAAVHDSALCKLRERIEAHSDAELARNEAVVELSLADGRTLRSHIHAARGSRERPMSDTELDAKFTAMALARLGAAGAESLRALCRSLPAADSHWLAAFARLARAPASAG